MEEILSRLPQVLLAWYDEHKRPLPWRADREPYHIWISEIMLQQTRVEAVKGYYARFLQELSTVETLANCDDERLHKLWEGLGYYSRVRNLKKAAQIIMERHGGIFPRSHSQVLALPGIGPYTAGAICSIAFDQPTPAVDGNVLRLLARLTADDTPVDTPAFKARAQAQLQAVYPARAGDFTQALMELGATLCGPDRAPDCAQCPCAAFCRGFRLDVAGKLPVRLPKKGRRTEEKTVLILSCGDLFALRQRPKQGLLAGLWEFPNVPGLLEPEQAIETAGQMGLRVENIYKSVEKSHVFTHIEWKMRGIYLEVREPAGDLVWRTAAQIQADTALPTAFRQFWE